MAQKKDTLKRNYVFSVAYQLLNIIIPLITTPYITRVLGVSNAGYNSYVSSIVNYFTLFAILGTFTYGQREIGSNQNNREEYINTFIRISTIKLILGIIVIAVYMFAIQRTDISIRPLFYMRVFTVLAVIIDVSWFFQGMENFRITVTRQIVIRVTAALLVFCFVKKPEDLIVYVGIDALLVFLSNLSILPFLKQYMTINELSEHIKQIRILQVRNTFLGSLGLFIPQMATSLYMSLDKSMLGFFYKDGIESGYYEEATKIHMIGITFVVALTNVMIPRIALLFKENEQEELKRLSLESISFIAFLGAPVAAGISAISFNLLPWFLGSDFSASSNVLQISAALILIMGITNFLGYGYLVATRQNKVYTLSVVIGTIINFIGNLIIIPQYGAVGAALSSVLSEMIVLIYQVVYLKNQIPIVIAFRKSARYVILAIVMCVVITLMSKGLASSAINSIICFITGVLIYVVPLVLLKDQNVVKIINTILKSIRKG